MEVNPQALKDFVLKHARDKRLIEDLGVFEHLQPFFDITETGEYRLASEGDLDQDVIAETIKLATDNEVSRLIFVSLTKLQERSRMADVAHERLLRLSFGRLTTDLWDNIKEKQWSNREKTFMENDLFIVDLREELTAPGLWGYISRSLKTDPWDRFQCCLVDSLHVYLAFAILGDKERVKQLQTFIELLPKAILLGEKKGEEGTWLVLVA